MYLRLCASVTIGVILAALIWPSAVHADQVTIVASVSGTPYPDNPTGTYPDVVVNGDFSIFRLADPNSPEDFAIGDGRDEHDSFLMDFTRDPNFLLVDCSQPFTAIQLTIDILGPSFSATDRVDIRNFGQDEAPTPGSYGRNVFDLMNYSTQYREPTIREALCNGYTSPDPRFPNAGRGQLSMSYADDAVISFAEMRITGQTVPEPSALLLLLLAFICLFRCQRVGSGSVEVVSPRSKCRARRGGTAGVSSSLGKGRLRL
jgi:hypothetical protein